MKERLWIIDLNSYNQVFGDNSLTCTSEGDFKPGDWPEGYIVIATSDYGREFHYPERFYGKKKATKFAARVTAHLANGGHLNLEKWNFYRNVPGSPASNGEVLEAA